VSVFVCFTYLGPVCLFCFFWCIFPPVCFDLSLPVQVIAWKDLSPNWPVVCQAGRKTLLTDSLWSTVTQWWLTVTQWWLTVIYSDLVMTHCDLQWWLTVMYCDPVMTHCDLQWPSDDSLWSTVTQWWLTGPSDDSLWSTVTHWPSVALHPLSGMLSPHLLPL